MTEAEMKAIVEEVVRRLSGSAPKEPARPRVVLLMTGAEQGFDRTMEAIAKMAAEFSVKAILAGCYTERYGVEPLAKALGCPKSILMPNATVHEKEAAVDAAAAVAVMLPLRTTLAKTARGQADSPPAVLLTRALMAGKPAFAAGGEMDPETWPAKMPAAMRHGQGSLAESVERDLATLASWGMSYRRDPLELLAPMRAALGLAKAREGFVPTIENPAGPIKVSTSGRREFVTAEDVRAAHRQGQRELRLSAHSIVTEEARDVAAALQVALLD
ncbi:hypothetical protein GC173_02430 [bacterium]|nr:hypothetical protein [bacterium]